MPPTQRPAWVEIDLDAIAYNCRALKGCLQGGAQLMAVVKADAYGHGAVAVARTALKNGASWLGVAILDEAQELLAAGLAAPVLVFGYLPELAAPAAAASWARITLYDLGFARALDAAARAAGRRVPVHIKVDTGMGRVGIRPQELPDFARTVAGLTGLDLEGVYTHFATADEPDRSFTEHQIRDFEQALAALAATGIRPRLRHAANSAAILVHPEGHFDLARAGISLYGLAPAAGQPWPVPLRPAMTVKSRIAFIKSLLPGEPVSYGRTWTARGGERVATIPIGYADGYRRLFSNRFAMLVAGQRCPIAGRVCMDQTVILLPPGLTAAVGDEVVLLGHQDGAEISADHWAAELGTINYEITCLMSRRMPRVYVPGEA